MNCSAKTKLELVDLNGIKLYIDKSDKEKRVLLASTFHGDEDCLDVIFHYLREGNKDIAISLIPIVNKYGIDNSIRENRQGDNINCSFNHPKCKKTMPLTVESISILDNLSLIKYCARDGYSSLHVDKNTDQHYSHIWMQETPSQFILDDLNVKDYNLCYNTLEDYLWHEGIPLTACLEYSKSREGRIEFTNKFLDYIL